MPFVIIVIGIILIVVNYRALKRENKSFSSILLDKEATLSEEEIEIVKLRREFSETVLELQLEIERLKAIKKDTDNNDNKTNTLDTETFESDETFASEVINVDKVNSVKELLDEGLSEEEVCEKLAIGKGEVLLIKNLYKD